MRNPILGLLTAVVLVTISSEAMAKNFIATCYSSTFSTLSRARVESIINEEDTVNVDRIVSMTSDQMSGLDVTVSTQVVLFKSSEMSEAERDLLERRLKKVLKKITHSSDDRDIPFRGCSTTSIQ